MNHYYNWPMRFTSDRDNKWWQTSSDTYLNGVALSYVESCLTGENGWAWRLATNPDGTFEREGRDLKREFVTGNITIKERTDVEVPDRS